VPEPLSLPRGSVRAILTVLVVLVAAAAVFVPIAPGADDARSMFVLVAGFVLRDYFHTRDKQNAQDGPPLGETYVREG
jgi:hypothetical protein